MAEINKYIRQHFRDNISLYTFTMVLIFIGIFFGAIIVNSLSIDQKNDLYLYLNRFFSSISNDSMMNASDLFNQSFTHYLKYFGLIWILGISVIGLPLILILLFLKGIVIGFTVGFLVSEMSFKGFFLAIVSVLPQNLILLPAITIIGVASLSFSMKMIRFQMTKSEPFAPILKRYSLLMLAIIVCLVISSSVEAYISPFLMKFMINLTS